MLLKAVRSSPGATCALLFSGGCVFAKRVEKSVLFTFTNPRRIVGLGGWKILEHHIDFIVHRRERFLQSRDTL